MFREIFFFLNFLLVFFFNSPPICDKWSFRLNDSKFQEINVIFKLVKENFAILPVMYDFFFFRKVHILFESSFLIKTTWMEVFGRIINLVYSLSVTALEKYFFISSNSDNSFCLWHKQVITHSETLSFFSHLILLRIFYSRTLQWF